MANETLRNGSTLQGGKYRIVKVLGQGGFGITYLAEQNLLESTFAIKEFFMRDLCARDGDVKVYTLTQHAMVDRYRQKFIKEAKLIAKHKHPGIVKVIDIFEENDTVYYVMEYVEGESLAAIVEREGPLSEQAALRYIKKVAEALDYLHQSNVNHLDIKPANIMVRREDDKPILIDFGVSKQYDSQKDETSTTPPGISKGYSPIEQYQSGGVSKFSPQADIYALGATLYKLLTGNTPPDASIVLNKGIPPLPDSISLNVRKAIEKAMKPMMDDRPKSMGEFVKMLGVVEKPKDTVKGKKSFLWRFFKGKTPENGKTRILGDNDWNRGAKQRQLWKWWAIGGVACIGIVLLMMLLFDNFKTEQPKIYTDSLQIDKRENTNGSVSQRKKIQRPVLEYEEIYDYSDGVAKVKNEEDKWGFIDVNGKEIISCKWKKVYSFSEGLASVQDEKDFWGVVDKNGNLVSPCIWKSAIRYSDGLARVEDEHGLYGYIDKNGKLVIPCKWKSAGAFSEGLAKAWNDKLDYGFIDKNGEEVIPFKYIGVGDFSEGLARASVDGKDGFIDKTGEIVIPYRWYFTKNFSEGLAGVKDDNEKWGFIDKKGNLVIPCKWKYTWDFSNGIAIVKDWNDKYGFINKDGDMVSPCKWAGIGNFSEGLLRVKDDNGKWGFVDKNNKIVVPCKWNFAEDFFEGMAIVKDENERCGFVDKVGKLVIPCNYVDVCNFYKGQAWVKDDSGKYHSIELPGK